MEERSTRIEPASRSGGRLLLWRLCYLQFSRTSDELLQLTFDGSIPDVLVLQYAIGIDGEGLRDGMNSKQCGDRPGETAVPILGPRHSVFCNKVFPFSLVLVQTHAQ